MTESIDYDLGYFEAMRNAVVAAIQCHMNGMEIGDIIKHLAQLRDEARNLYDDSNKLEEEGDDW